MTSPPFVPEVAATRVATARGDQAAASASFPGDTRAAGWPARPKITPGRAQLPAGWLREQGGSGDLEDLASGVLMLVCGDVIRPGLAWMLTRTHRYLASAMAQTGDPGGFARLRTPAEAEPASSGRTPGSRTPVSRPCWPARAAASPASPSATAWNSSTCNAGCTREAARRSTSTSAPRPGCLSRGRTGHDPAFGLAAGRLSIKELVDRYRLECAPVRDLIVDYLRERQPSLDFASLDAISRTLAGLFWAEIGPLPGHRLAAPATGRGPHLEGEPEDEEASTTNAAAS